MGVKVKGRIGTYRYLIVGLLTLLVTISIGVTAFGGQFEDAVTAYNRGDYATAYRLFKPLAEQGNDKAQLNLGFLYENGQGVPQDYTEAVKWYRKAAEQGNIAAQFNLGVIYDKGQGVPQDYTEVEKWWRKAAEQGLPKAQINLGFMYGRGQGVPQDYVQAHMWFNLAASRFPASEGEKRELAGANRDLVASKMTPAQIAEAQRLAREWKPKKEVE